ncbi:uncharacterized protein PODANS_3_10140, partial [Podospora anserina S mat+]
PLAKTTVKDKAQHAVILDKTTSDKLYKDVQSYRLVPCRLGGEGPDQAGRQPQQDEDLQYVWLMVRDSSGIVLTRSSSRRYRRRVNISHQRLHFNGPDGQDK